MSYGQASAVRRTGIPGRGFLDYWMGRILGNCFLSTENTEDAEDGNGNFFCPRRGAEKGDGNIFCPRRTRRGTEKGDGNIFCPRRTRRGTEKGDGNFNTFCPRRTRRARRTSTAFLSTEDTEGHGGLQQLFFVRGGHGEARRTSTPFDPLRDAKGREENLFCPRRARGTAFSIRGGAPGRPLFDEGGVGERERAPGGPERVLLFWEL